MSRKPQKDRTSFLIAVVLHAILIGGVVFWAWKTGKLEQMRQAVLQYVRSDKKEQKQDTKPIQQKAVPQAKLPPINQGLTPSTSSGTRRAVASDAPAAAGGESFFQDTRTQAGETSPASAPVVKAQQEKPAPKLVVKAPSPPRMTFGPPAATTVKALLQERAKASAMVESFGTEQISKSTVSDAADIIGKISGATVVDGKFAVIRGLADRYTSTTFNGVSFPSADPDRRAAQLDLIPAQFISRLDVNKTFTPDMPGGFVGGAIDIVTRSFPEKFMFSASAGMSYNTQSNLKDGFPTSDQGSTDWLAMDDGMRALPSEIERIDPRGNSILPRSVYDSFGSRQVTPTKSRSPANQSYAISVGDSAYLFGRRFGYMAGLNYKSEYQFYGEGGINRFQFGQNGVRQLADKNDAKGVIENTWSALASLSYEIADDHELGFTYVRVQTSEDEARFLSGTDEDALGETEEGQQARILNQSILHWTERSLDYRQLKGRHVFPALREARLDWVGAMATATQDEPDLRMFQYSDDGPASYPYRYFADVQTNPNRPLRFWRDILEENNSFRADLTIPLPSYNSKENAFKTGLWISRSEREFNSRILQFYNTLSHPFTTTGDTATYLDPANFPYIIYRNNPSGNWIYSGAEEVDAHYFMGDWAVLEWLRAVGGLRFENTKISVAAFDLTTGTPRSSPPIDQSDILPAVGLTVSLRENLQARLGYSQTVTRPAYRELGRAEIIDVAENKIYQGNPDLQMAAAENLDLRVEWFPRPGELFSLSLFQKSITQPIEQVAPNRETVTYRNSPDAEVQGVEAEWRMNLDLVSQSLNEFTIGANAAYIQSTVPLTPAERINRSLFGDTATSRPLYDQPQYLFNGDLTWERKSWGTMLNLSAGLVGRRLVVAGVRTPDEFEEPAPQLDVTFSQKLGRHWRLKFSARNLLDPPFEKIQEHPSLGPVTIASYTKGMTFGVSLGCEF